MNTVLIIAGIMDTLTLLYSHSNRLGLKLGIPITRM